MKQILILCAGLALATAAHAQAHSNNLYIHTSNVMENHHQPAAPKADPFSKMTMEVSGKQVTFSGIPAKRRAIFALVTDAQGNIVKQSKISRLSNVLDMHKQHSGLYFITIRYLDVNKKAFIAVI